MKLSEGDTVHCWGCLQDIAVVAGSGPRRGLLELPRHNHAGNIGAYTRCSVSGSAVTRPGGETRLVFAGPIAGVTVSEVFSALENLTTDMVLELNGDEHAEITGRDDAVDDIMALLARAAEGGRTTS